MNNYIPKKAHDCIFFFFSQFDIIIEVAFSKTTIISGFKLTGAGVEFDFTQVMRHYPEYKNLTVANFESLEDLVRTIIVPEARSKGILTNGFLYSTLRELLNLSEYQIDDCKQ